jgi:hypothetical protein
MTDADCCSNFCRGCFCQGEPKNGDPCEQGSAIACHWGICQNGTCSCNPVGAPCQNTGGIDKTCCSLNCGQNGACADGLLTEGSPCTENRWCYNGLCVNGRCGSFWCQDTQGGGLKYTDPCTSDSQCNSGVCPISFMNSGNCSCVENGGSCTDDRNCCHLTCNGGVCQ